ncbi:hypothetical protein TrVE_jg6468 [Triparma verrucosa]|uniref:Uncharacterized protein n=1 Tax=Triparma verrucosa TaxID=1606542 RepID=A0A9W7C0X1_9STRA|nr:hypothetical protein TrVE_jg6468 [Triparma verrucosa]
MRKSIRAAVGVKVKRLSLIRSELLDLHTGVLFFGAGLSIIDMIFDILMVYEFALQGQLAYASATLGTVIASLLLQLVLTFEFHGKEGWWSILREMLFVVLLIKPGIDASRVVKKRKRRVNSILDPHTEMLIFKSTELVLEVIPGAIIQAIAFVSGQRSNVATLSLISSLCTVGFISADIAIEKDVNKRSRMYAPFFYGIVPLTSVRGTVCISILFLLLSTSQLSLRIFALALCVVESRSIAAAYVGIEVGLMLVIKLIRRDFIYWPAIPNVTPLVLMSFASRCAVKLIMDFTGMLQARHPYEMGGAYFSFTLLTTPLIGLYFGSRYIAYIEDFEPNERPDFAFASNQVYYTIAILGALQICCYALLIKLVDSKYRWTFVSTMTGKQYCFKGFHEASDDFSKFEVLTNNRFLWKNFEEEIKEWLSTSIPTWLAEEAEWFDDAMKAQIPDSLVDDPALLLEIRGQSVARVIRNNSRRRSSIAAMIVPTIAGTAAEG